jgi:hypothetical protein
MFRIRNFGNSRTLPCGKDSYFIAAQSFIDIEDANIAKALSQYPYIEATTLTDETSKVEKIKAKQKDVDNEVIKTKRKRRRPRKNK